MTGLYASRRTFIGSIRVARRAGSQQATMLVVELTAKQNDKTSAEERMRLFRTKTFREGIETFTRTIARRLRDLCDGGEESENGTVH